MSDDDSIIIDFGEPSVSMEDPDLVIVDFLPPPPSSLRSQPGYYNQPSSSAMVSYGDETDLRQPKHRQRSVQSISRTNSQVDPLIKFMEEWPHHDDVKNRAAQIYRDEMDLSNQHPESKTQALCYCLFCTYRERGEHVDPFLLGMSIGLSPEKTAGCFSKYNNKRARRSKGVDGWIDPVELLPQYATRLGLTDDFIENMKDSFRRMLEKSKTLYEEEGGDDLSEKPVKTIVAAYMLNYLQSMGNYPEEISYASIFRLKIATIKNLSKKIGIIENK